MNRITTPTADAPATLNPRKWYIGNIDEGVTAGPFNTKSAAMLHLCADRCEREMWGDTFSGFYTPMVYGERSHNSIAKGADFAGYVGVTV